MKITLLSVLLLLPYLVIAQKCNCPSEGLGNTGKPHSLFSFTNGKKIGLCGYREIKNNDTTYSEFALVQCGQKKPIEEWGAVESCKIKKVNDTLFVKELYGLPIGKDFTVIWMPFYINKFYFTGNTLQKKKFYRKDIKKYSKEQIRQVLTKYEKLTRGNFEHTIDVANMLFWAYVSGNNEAEVYLKTIPKKFGPFDGAIAEEWDDISATYELWKEKNTIN